MRRMCSRKNEKSFLFFIIVSKVFFIFICIFLERLCGENYNNNNNTYNRKNRNNNNMNNRNNPYKRSDL